MKLPVAPVHTALKRLKPVIGGKQTIPILNHVLVSINGFMLNLSGTDMDMWLRIEVELEGEAVEGLDLPETALPLLPFENAVAIAKKAKCEFIDLSVEGADFELTWTGGSFQGKTLPAEDWPKQPDEKQPMLFDTPTGFCAALAFCEPAISTEETRYYLNGIALDATIASDGLTPVATDGARLQVYALNPDQDPKVKPFLADEIEPVIAPRAAIDWLIANQPHQIGWNETRLTAESQDDNGGFSFTTKLIDGTFPSFRRVIPDQEGLIDTLTIQRTDLLNALQELASFNLGDKKNSSCNLNVAEDSAELLIQAQGEDQSLAQTSLILNRTGDKALRIGVNTKYLIDICQSYKGDSLKLFVKADFTLAPLRFESMDDADAGKTSILMPYRV